MPSLSARASVFGCSSVPLFAISTSPSYGLWMWMGELVTLPLTVCLADNGEFAEACAGQVVLEPRSNRVDGRNLPRATVCLEERQPAPFTRAENEFAGWLGDLTERTVRSQGKAVLDCDVVSHRHTL